jgi:transcription elongation factor Elf1
MNRAARRALERNKSRLGVRAFRCPSGHEETINVVIATKGGRDRVVDVEQRCSTCGLRTQLFEG